MANLYQVFCDLGLRFYSAKAKDGVLQVMASTHEDQFRNPIIEVGHKFATSIAFRIKDKNIYIQRINSKQRGMGTKMVDAVMAEFPGYSFSVVDGSLRKGATGPTFWDKMAVKHPKLAVTKPNVSPSRINAFALSLKLASIINKRRI